MDEYIEVARTEVVAVNCEINFNYTADGEKILQFWVALPLSLRETKKPGEKQWQIFLVSHDDDGMGEIDVKNVVANAEVINYILALPYDLCVAIIMFSLFSSTLLSFSKPHAILNLSLS